MSIAGHCVPPSSSLPPVRSATEDQITSALRNLQAIYCPLRLPPTLSTAKTQHKIIGLPITPANVDSGYVSEDEVTEEDDESAAEPEDALTALRADAFERSVAVRWLTNLIGRIYELSFGDEEERERVLEEAASILSSFSEPTDGDQEEAVTRDFSFPLAAPSTASIKIQLNDAPLSGTDHTDVGLQSWGASIILSGLLCTEPECFGINKLPANTKIIELGAGTGLVSLTLAKLLPVISSSGASVLATDYHTAVLDNLRANIATNFPSGSTSACVSTRLLDWSDPPACLTSSAHMLFAADVVYAPEHAAWLRDCATELLAPDSVFWLMVTVRKVGKFEGIPETAEAAFVGAVGAREKNGKKLGIVGKRMLEKQRGVGRGDETGYMLFEIRWI